ncbi:MAG: hypothetical protein CMJ27_07730 [Phycisphaerae bacterium]|nr:hypothetical protein [Phycisphaerae bacterium]
MSDAKNASRLDGIRIGILHHSGSKLVRQGYLIDSMADLWKGRGAEVVDIVGTDTPRSRWICSCSTSTFPSFPRRIAASRRITHG